MRFSCLLLLITLSVLPAASAQDEEQKNPTDVLGESELAVLSDGFTSWVGLHRDGGWDLWGFAQKAWYLDMRQGVRGGLSTALPKEGIVLRAHLKRLPANRHGRLVRAWIVSTDAHDAHRMLTWIRAHVDTTWIYRPDPSGDTWHTVEATPTPRPRLGWMHHPTDLSYTIWWNCHDYTLTALWMAGLVKIAKPSLVVTADDLEAILSERFGDPIHPE